MKNFIMGLILAVVSIGASAAPTISDDQLRRIAAIALEQQAEKPEPAKAPVKIASKPELFYLQGLLAAENYSFLTKI